MRTFLLLVPLFVWACGSPPSPSVGEPGTLDPVPARIEPRTVHITAPGEGNLDMPNGRFVHYQSGVDADFPAHVGWWRYDSAGSGRVRGASIDLRPHPTAAKIREVARSTELTALYNDDPWIKPDILCRDGSYPCSEDEQVFQLKPLCDGLDAWWPLVHPCVTRLEVTTTALSEQAHIHRAVDRARGAVAPIPDDTLARVFVRADGRARENLQARFTMAPQTPTCRAHDWHVVAQSRDGHVSSAAMATLVELTTLLLDEQRGIDAAIVEEADAQCDTGAGVVLPADGSIDRAAFCRAMLVEGHGLAGCGALLELPAQACGQVLDGATDFVCHDRSFEDLSPLLDHTSLRTIDVSGTKVRSIAALESLPQLERVVLSDTEVEDVRPLRRTRVADLDVRRTPVVSGWPAGQMPALVIFDVRGATVDPYDLVQLHEQRPTLKVIDR